MSAALTAFFFVPPGSLARPGGGAEDVDDVGAGGVDEVRAGGGDESPAGGGVDEREGGDDDRSGGDEGERGAAAGLAAGFSAEPADAPLLIGLLAMARTAR
jgi:hypothetical protein